MPNVGQDNQCFACGRAFKGGRKYLVDTRDAQLVFVGLDCFRAIQKAGERGFQPKGGGPKLYPL